MAFEAHYIDNDNPTTDTRKLRKLKVVFTQEVLAGAMGFSNEHEGGPSVSSVWYDPTRGIWTMVLSAPADREIYANGERVHFNEIPEGQEMPEWAPSKCSVPKPRYNEGKG